MTPSRIGVTDATTDGSFAQDNELFLKTFSGEVLTAFEETNVMKDLHMQRTISSGKSASFPATWKTGAGYHTPGSQLLGSQSVAHNERIINVDDFLISDIFVAKIDELKNHYDIRSEYTKQMGAALAREYDMNTMQVAILAARAAATVTGGNGGSIVKNTAAATDAAVLTALVYNAAQAFDEKDIPVGDRVMIVKPAQYYLLLTNKDLLNKDYSNGGGDFVQAKIETAAGIDIIKSNNVPSTNIAAATAGENNTYFGDYSDTVAACFHRSAIGTVKMMDLAVSKTADDGDFFTQYNGTLMTAKYLMGHGILRPEASIEISKAI